MAVTDVANSGIALLEKLKSEFTPLTEANDLDYSVEPPAVSSDS